MINFERIKAGISVSLELKGTLSKEEMLELLALCLNFIKNENEPAFITIDFRALQMLLSDEEKRRVIDLFNSRPAGFPVRVVMIYTQEMKANINSVLFELLNSREDTSVGIFTTPEAASTWLMPGQVNQAKLMSRAAS